MLNIEKLNANLGEKQILKNINLNIPKGEIHVLMGPNGVGKSTLGHVLMGHKTYTQTSGSITIDGVELTNKNTAERAHSGLFLAFQYPVSIPGLKISEYLRNLYVQRFNTQIGVAEFRKILKEKLEIVNIERSVLSRYLNEGFSGGEMKRLEMLQLLTLQPKVAILDEIDSGVDVDAQKTVADAILYARNNYNTSFVIITHYQRLLTLIKPDKIHVILDGTISQSGDISLVHSLEQQGYNWVRQNAPNVV